MPPRERKLIYTIESIGRRDVVGGKNLRVALGLDPCTQGSGRAVDPFEDQFILQINGVTSSMKQRAKLRFHSVCSSVPSSNTS